MFTKLLLLSAAAPLLAAAPLESDASAAGFSREADVEQGQGGQLMRGGRRDLMTRQQDNSWIWQGKKAGYLTFFHGMGTPTGGCGVPPNRAYDDNWKPLPYVALNTNSEFAGGSNCGRWVEITLGQNCIEGGNKQWQPCYNGQMRDDRLTGRKIYGYVMDSCPDMNFWCQMDDNHLDVSADYLDSINLNQGGMMAARMLHWNYINYVPDGWSMKDLKFQVKENSVHNGWHFWVVINVYNTRNGISKVEQYLPELKQWVYAPMLSELGNAYVMKNPMPQDGKASISETGGLRVRVFDKDGNSYGAYKVGFPCGRGVCGSPTDCWSEKM